MLMLTVVLPIMAPFARDEEHLQLQNNVFAELQSLGTIAPINKDFGESTIGIRVLNNPSEEPLLKGIWKVPHPNRQYRLLVFEIDGQACFEQILRESKVSTETRLTAEEMASLVQMHVLTCLELEINSFLLLCNILRPGSLSADSGYAFTRKQQCGRTAAFFAEDLFSAVESAQQLGWPRFYKPTLLQGWNWMRTSGALVDGIGVGRLGRSLAALSHLTAPDLRETSSIELVWVLLGLEALYSRGNVGLKDQLLGKSEALLGPRTENKRAFGAVYDFRSRLLHGDVDLPLRFTEFNAVQKFEDYHTELWRNEKLALAVLLATLQWMVVAKVKELNFEYALSSGMGEPAT